MNDRPSVLHLTRAALGALALTIAATATASAQSTDPMAAQPAPLTQPAAPPSYATPVSGESISGHITAITGKYTLQVRDTRGFIDNVVLHQGTIINPTGLQLAAGMQVTITGTNAGAAFAANQIDAPYTVALVPGYRAGLYDAGFGFGYGGWGFGPRFRAGFSF